MSKNLMTRPSEYCCGLTELGNFDYIDPPDGKKMTHYHKIGGSWSVQGNAKEGTTKEQILATMGRVHSAGYVCTTGAGQEYVEPLLAEIGFQNVFTYINPGHASTPIKMWVYSKHAKKE